MPTIPRLLITALLAIGISGCAQNRHGGSSMPEPARNPTTAADILDNYLFGGLLRAVQSLGGPTVDRIRLWTTDPLRVAIFAPEQDEALVIATLERYADLSGKRYVVTRDDSDIVFVVQRKLSDIDLDRAVFEETDIGYRVGDPWDDSSEHLTHETVAHYAEGNSDMPDYFQGVDDDFEVTFLYGTPARPFEMPAMLVLIDTPAEPADDELSRGIYSHVGATLVPHALVASRDPRYDLFDPQAPRETRRAIEAYYAAGLRPGMTRAQVMEKVTAALANIP